MKSFSWIKKVKGFLLDLDGTLYLGEELLPGAEVFLKKLRERGKKILFLTNNSSKTPLEYREKLSRLGIVASSFEIFTSLEGAVVYLKKKRVQSLFPLATSSVVKYLEKQGFQIAEDSPERVLLTYDTELCYEKLATACLLIEKGVPYVATHPDVVCPTPWGMLPDCGAMLAMIQAATQRSPEVVLGKPHPEFGRAALERLQLPPEQVVIVGDRLYTDMEMGHGLGLFTLLVLTGETKEKDLEKARLTPHGVAHSLEEVIPYL